MLQARGAFGAALVAAALAAPLVPTAEAAVVRLDRLHFDCTRTPCPPSYSEQLVVRAGRGEDNRLSVARGAAGEFQITDAGTPLNAGPGCTAAGNGGVDCQTSSPILTALVFAGDRADTVSASVAITMDGGRGDDRLTGSPFGDVLHGGGGRDVLRGEGGDDALRDGRLGTPIAPVRPERDVFDGGDGTDTLGYEGRRRGVSADLARADGHAGARGERDALRGLEDVTGGNGDDRLLGDDAANLLWGGTGDDLLVGRGGDDQLEGREGSNRARGGAGDDIIGAGQNADVLVNRQRVSCGPGQDLAASLFLNDFAEDDCETVSVGLFHEIDPLLPPHGGPRPAVASYTTEPFDCEATSCLVRLDLRLARSPAHRAPHPRGLLLGRVSATIPPRAVTTLTVRLSGRGSRLLRRYRSLLVRIQLDIDDLSDPRAVFGGAYLTRLRAPAP